MIICDECGNHAKWKTRLAQNCIQCLYCYKKFTVRQAKKLKNTDKEYKYVPIRK